MRATGSEPAFVVWLPPQHIAEQLFGPLTVIAGPSRLAFQVDDDVDEVPFSLEGLLNWSHQRLSVAANAVAELPGPG